MALTSRADALVIGAGPAGSATAAGLARAGLRIVLVDRATFPRDKPCSEYMSPEVVRILDRLGLVGALEAQGAQPILGTTVFGPRGSSVTGVFAEAAVAPFRPTGLAVSRRILDAELAALAVRSGAELLEGTAAEALLYDDGRVAGAVVRDQSGARRTIRARLTVGADGLRSLVARRIGRRAFGAPSRLAFVAHVSRVEGLGPVSEMHVGEAGYVGLNRIGPALANVAVVVPYRAARTAAGRVEDWFFERLDAFPGVRGRVPRGSLTRPVIVTGPFAAWSGRAATEGALLVGDAADFFDPFTGQGIHAALRGADLVMETVLPPLLAGAPLTAATLRPYVSARRREFLGKWLVERMIGHAMWLPGLFDRAVGRLGRRNLGHTLIGVTGDFVPARRVLHPLFLARMVV